MEQQKTITDLIKTTTTLPMNSWSETQSTLLENCKKRAQIVVFRFGTKENFLTKVNPDTQGYFGKYVKVAVMGDYPTLADISNAYGNGFDASWLVPQLTDVSIHTGAKNLTKEQLKSLARIISVEYRHLKITELLLFFYRFKAGHYGCFYGNVDPMVVTCALRDFMNERALMINQFMQEERERKQEEERRNNKCVTREEYLQMKQKQIQQ